MTIAKEEKPLSLIMAKETYRKLLTDPKLQAELLIQFLTKYSPNDNDIDDDYTSALLDFELALLSVERRFMKLQKEGEKE